MRPFFAVVAAAVQLSLLRAAPPGEGWQLVFEDDFDGSAINTTSWTVRNNFTHGSGEWQLYLEEDVYLQDANGVSNLVLRTRRNPTQGPPQGSQSKGFYNYTSGWVDSARKTEFTYGHFEFRAILPNPNASHVWPTLWLTADGMGNTAKCWPVGGEIDIAEANGGFANNAIFGTYHWGEACGSDDWAKDHYNQLFPNSSSPSIDFSLGYHVFGATWTNESIIWYVDGAKFEVRTPGDSNPETLFIPSWDLYLILNTAISFWGSSGVDPSFIPSWTDTVYMYIDWVRVWQ